MMVSQPIFLNFLLFVGTSKMYVKNIFGFYISLNRSHNKLRLTFIRRNEMVRQQSKLIIHGKRESNLNSLRWPPNWVRQHLNCYAH